MELGFGGGRRFRLVQGLYNWIANILGNIWFRPQQSPPATDAVPPNHPSKLTLPTFELQQVFILLAAFLVFLFTYILQRREDGVIDSALSRRVSSQPIYMPSWRVQLPGRVPKSPLQPSLHRTNPGVFFLSRSCCPSASGPCFGFFLFLTQPKEQAASSHQPSLVLMAGRPLHHQPSLDLMAERPLHHQASLVLMAGQPLHHQLSLVLMAGRPLHHQPSWSSWPGGLFTISRPWSSWPGGLFTISRPWSSWPGGLFNISRPWSS